MTAEVENTVLSYLVDKDFRAASLAIAAFEAQQPCPRGIGVDWRNYNSKGDVVALSAIFSHIPGILEGVTPDAVEPLRLAAAMMLLCGRGKPLRRWLARDLHTGIRFKADTAASMFLFYGFHQRELQNWSGVNWDGCTKKVYISTCPDACPECKRLAGQIYATDKIPELPHPACISDKGCHCTFLVRLNP